MIKHIWFDVGGTLYRETPAFDAVHDKLRYETFANITGTPPGEVKSKYDALYKQHGSNSAVFTSLGKPSDFWQIEFESVDLANVLEPDENISRVVSELSSLVPVSLFSNFKLSKINAVLDLVGVDRANITHIISGDDIQKRKPDLEGFNKMVQTTGLPAGQILYVGDRVDVDIKPAKAVGMQTCLVWQESPEADISAPDFPQMLDRIKQKL